MKTTNWKDCIRNRPNGKNSLRRPKLLWSCSALRRRRNASGAKKFLHLYWQAVQETCRWFYTSLFSSDTITVIVWGRKRLIAWSNR
jgi:hypothetical protein